MTNEEIAKQKKVWYNLSDEEYENLRQRYIQDIEKIIANYSEIKTIIENHGFTRQEDWLALSDLICDEFTYIDGVELTESLDVLFEADFNDGD